MPPAFSQSALVRYCDMSLVPRGLADGELLPDAPGVVLGLMLGEPAPLGFSAGLLGLLGAWVPLVPPPVCAKASTGTRATTATKSATVSFFMFVPPRDSCNPACHRLLRVVQHRHSRRAISGPANPARFDAPVDGRQGRSGENQ